VKHYNLTLRYLKGKNHEKNLIIKSSKFLLLLSSLFIILYLVKIKL